MQNQILHLDSNSISWSLSFSVLKYETNFPATFSRQISYSCSYSYFSFKVNFQNQNHFHICESISYLLSRFSILLQIQFPTPVYFSVSLSTSCFLSDFILTITLNILIHISDSLAFRKSQCSFHIKNSYTRACFRFGRKVLFQNEIFFAG